MQTVGPVSITVDASWGLYSSGVYDGCSADADLDHGVQLVGYGTEKGSDFYLVRNSWGEGWGEGGYIKLFREANPSCDEDPSPGSGNGCKGGPAKQRVCGACGILNVKHSNEHWTCRHCGTFHLRDPAAARERWRMAAAGPGAWGARAPR